MLSWTQWGYFIVVSWAPLHIVNPVKETILLRLQTLLHILRCQWLISWDLYLFLATASCQSWRFDLKIFNVFMTPATCNTHSKCFVSGCTSTYSRSIILDSDRACIGIRYSFLELRGSTWWVLSILVWKTCAIDLFLLGSLLARRWIRMMKGCILRWGLSFEVSFFSWGLRASWEAKVLILDVRCRHGKAHLVVLIHIIHTLIFYFELYFSNLNCCIT